MSNRSRAESFDKVAKTYDQARPGYPQMVYAIVDSHKKLGPRDRVLEIGAGHGVATEEIYNYWQTPIVAIEPGGNLATILKNKFQRNESIQVENCRFEEFRDEDFFDCIFSATAFHWIDKQMQFKKSYQLLKEDGLLVLYWNNYALQDERVHSNIQEIYRRFHPATPPEKDVRLLLQETIAERKKDLESSEYFDLIGHHEIITRIVYPTNRYLNLLRSFSTNSVIEQDKIEAFYTEIEKYIQSINNAIELRIVTNLEIGSRVSE